MPSSCTNALRVAITTEIWLLMVPLQASKPPRGSKVSTAVLEWRKCNSACQAAGQPSALMRQVREVEWVTQQSGEASIATGPNRQSLSYSGYAHKSKMLNVKRLFLGGGEGDNCQGLQKNKTRTKSGIGKKKVSGKKQGKMKERIDWRKKEGKQRKGKMKERMKERRKKKDRRKKGKRKEERIERRNDWRVESEGLKEGMEQSKTLKEMYEGWEGMKKKKQEMKKMNEKPERKEGN